MTIADLYRKTKGKTSEEIEKLIREMLKAGELADLQHSLPIAIDFDSGEISWKCASCGNCTADLWDLFMNDGIMLDRFDDVCCGYRKSMGEFDDEFDFEGASDEDFDF